MSYHLYRLLTFTDVDAFKTQQIAKHLNFSFQFTNEFSVRIFIDDRLADNLLRTIRVPNTTSQRLFKTATQQLYARINLSTFPSFSHTL